MGLGHRRVATECMDNGCAAAECGVASLSCTEAALICGNQLLQCALIDPSVAWPPDLDGGDEDEAHEDKNLTWAFDLVGAPHDNATLTTSGNLSSPPAWCSSSLCMGRYFSCMTLANCSSPAETSIRASTCRDAGCSARQCRADAEPELPWMPDMPSSVTVASIPDNRLQVQWTPSDQAVTWARAGSSNIVLQYHIVLLQDCERREGGATCSNVPKANLTVSAFHAHRVVFGGLDVAIMYQAKVGPSRGSAFKALRIHAGPNSDTK